MVNKMCDCMEFPKTVDEFMENYKIIDSEQIYTNGTELVPIFRMKQWFEHLAVRKFQPMECIGIGEGAAYRQGWNDAIDAIMENESSVDVVEIVRCKDCKHRPTGEERDDLEFPDDKCPCKCEDYWYSWKPSDNWFCGNGERIDD